jgi:hypothetical protein
MTLQRLELFKAAKLSSPVQKTKEPIPKKVCIYYLKQYLAFLDVSNL